MRYASDDYLLLAATTWNTFLCDLRLGNGGGLEIKVRGDEKQVGAGATQRLETFILLRGSHWADLMEAYARRLAAMPRTRKPQLDNNWGGRKRRTTASTATNEPAASGSI